MTHAFNTNGGRPTALLYHHSTINSSDPQGDRNCKDEEIWGSI